MSNRKSVIGFNSVSSGRKPKLSKRRLLASLVTSAFLLQQPAAFGQSAPSNMDFSSTNRSMTMSELGNQSVTIRTGGAPRAVDSQTLLTPAEYMAVMQVLSGGRQSLQIATPGNATGGTVNISAAAQSVSNLVIPHGVTSLTQSANLDILGNLTNGGNFFLYSTLGATATANVNATNIQNMAGATISSVLPAGILGNLPTASRVDLTLNALQGIVNAGTISSSGNLNMSAGTSIVNTGIIQGALDVGLTSPAITNSNLINALGGNINVDAANAAHIVINNTGGTFQALQGALNVRDAAFNAKSNFTMTGGNVLTESLNVFSGTGTANLNINEVTGVINISAGAAHVLANTSNLQLGSMTILGDPTYFNVGGSVTINNAITTTGNPLAIIAKGDILSTASGSISTYLGSGGAGNILIMAGTQFTVVPGTATGNEETGSQNGGNGDTTSTLYISGASLSGGKVDLSNITTFTAEGGGGAGGNVSIIAFGGTGSNSGTVTLPTAPAAAITTAGTGAPNGNVLIMAGARSGTAISTGAINTYNSASGNAGEGGEVLLIAATPIVTGSLQVNTGIATGGIIMAGQLQPSAINVGGTITTNSAPVTVVAGGNIGVGGDIVTNGTRLTGGLVPGNIALMAGGNIASTANNLTLSSAGATGQNGGNIMLVAGAKMQPFGMNPGDPAVTIDFQGASWPLSATFAITGASASGGSIDLTGGGSNIVSTITSAGATADTQGYQGGALHLISYAGSLTGSGTIKTGGTGVTSIATGGSHDGSGNTNPTNNNNGNVTVLAGAASGTSIQLGDINTAGSNAGGGDITVKTAAASASLPVSYTTGNDGITNGAFVAGTLQNASATVGNLTASGGYVSLVAPPLGSPPNLSTTITVSTGSNLSIGTVANTNNTMKTGEPSSSIIMSAGGVMTLTGTGVDASAAADDSGLNAGRNAGSISLSATAYNMSATNVIAANGTGGFDAGTGFGGNGGTISIVSTGPGTGTNSSAITVGANKFEIQATNDAGGGNSGNVTISSGSNISIDPTLFNVAPQAGSNSTPGAGSTATIGTGTGATVNLIAGTYSTSTVAASGTVFIDGSFDVNGAASQFDPNTNTGNPGGSGGQLSITVNSKLPFNIGGASTGSANGSTGNLTANGNIVDTGTPDAAAAFGSGGSISVTNKGTGGILVQNGALQVQAANAIGTATTIGETDFGGGNGGSISLIATNGKVLSNGALDASGGANSATRGNGSGGSIYIYSNSTTPFIIGNVAGMTNGVMGGVTATATVAGATPTGASPNVIFTTPGDGGSISINNAGTGGIAIDSTGTFSVAAAPANATLGTFGGQGGNIVLNAPNGRILSMLSLDASGGAAASSTPVNPGAAVSAGSDVVIQISDTTGLAIGRTINIASTTSRETPYITDIVANTTITVDFLANSYTTSDTITAYYPAGLGGTISITSKSTTPFMIGTGSNAPVNKIGTGTGVIGTLTANGFSGGSISVTNLASGGIKLGSGALTVTATAPAATVGGNDSGNGGNIVLNAPAGPVSILGGLDVSGSSGGTTVGYTNGGNAGSILITTGSASPFKVAGLTGTAVNGSASPLTANGGVGIATSGAAGAITIINTLTGGITVAANSIQVTAPPATASATAGNGGSISLQSPNGPVQISGTLSADGGLGNTNNQSGQAGSISISTKSTSAFNIGSGTLAGITANGWNGGQISIINYGTGGIIVQDGDLQAAAQSANTSAGYQGGPGGNISLQALAGKVLINNSLNVNGGGGSGALPGGDGGQIVITTSSTTPFLIGGATTNGSTGALSANGVNGGVVFIYSYGTGGIRLATPSNLTVTAADATATAAGGNGGAIYLQSKGNVYIGGNLSANGGASLGAEQGGNGGIISITTSSTTAFNIGSPAVNGNGIAGILSATGASGGSIGIKNNGTGGITFNPNNIVVTANGIASASGGSGGTIDLQAPAGTLSNSVAGTLSADAIQNDVSSANGGAITLAAKTINTSAGVLKLSAEGDPTAGHTASGGFIGITQTVTNGILTVGNNSNLVLDVDGSPAGDGGIISLSNAGNIVVNGKLTTSITSLPQTGTINITASGKGTITNGSQPISTGLLNISVATGGVGMISPLDTNVAQLRVNSANTIQIENSGALEILSATTSTGNLTIVNTGDVTVSGVVSAPVAVSISALSGTADSNLVINGNIVGQTVALEAEGATTGGQISGTGLVSATSNAATALTLRAGAGGINTLLTSAGAIFLDVTGVNNATNVSIVNNGSVLLNLGTSENIDSFSLTNTGSITTKGDITAKSITLDNGNNDNQSIILGGNLTGSTPTGTSVTITAGGSIEQNATSYVITANAITLSSTNGNIGFSLTPLKLDTLTAGTLAVSTTTGGGAFLTSSGSVDLGPVSTAGDFSLIAQGTINLVSDVASRFGSVSITNGSTSTGDIVINSAALPALSVTGGGGPVLINNKNLAGQINVLAGTTLTGNGRMIDGNPFMSQAGVALYSGAFPTPPTNTTASANVSVTSSGGFNAYFGDNGVTAAATVDVVATGANVVFNGNSPTTIDLASGVKINATATTKSLSSLDLTNKTLVLALVNLQSTPNSGVTGTLKQSGGVVSGGTLIIDPSVSLINLQGLNIPSSVTLQFANFTENNPVVVTTQSPQKNAIIAGNVQFIGTNNFSSTGILLVNSNVIGQTLTMTSAGELTSDNHLAVNVGGSATLAGLLTAGTNGNLRLMTGAANPGGTTATIPAAGTLTLNAVISAGGANDLGTITINSSGSILQMAGSITASDVSLSVGGANVGSPASQISGKVITAGKLHLTAGSGSAVTATATGAGLTAGEIELTVHQSPVKLLQTEALTVSGSVLGALTLQATAGITTNAALSCGTCTLTTTSLTNLYTISALNPTGSVNITSPAGKALTVTGANDVLTGTISAPAGISIISSTSLSINGGILNTGSGALVLTGKTLTTTIQNVTATAGALQPSYFSGLLRPTDIATAGKITISGATGLTINGQFDSIGGNVQATASSGPITVDGIYNAYGGNILVLAPKSISGSSPSFNALALGTAATNSIGGGIEVSSGSTGGGSYQQPAGTRLLAAFELAPGTMPTIPVYQPLGGGAPLPLGTNIVINNLLGQAITTGVVQQTIGAGTSVNLSTSGANPAMVNLLGGAMVFTTTGTGNSINFDGASFNTSAFRPIVFKPSPAAQLSLEEELSEESAGENVAHVLSDSHDGLRTYGTSSRGKESTFVFTAGSCFINTLRDTTIRTPYGNIKAQKGAQLSLTMENAALRVAVCSGPGHVSIDPDGRALALLPGEEILISDAEITAQDLAKEDGVGRRNCKMIKLTAELHAGLCEFSMISMLANHKHLANLRQPQTGVEKRLAEAFLRQAAVLSVVTGKRGAYQARNARPEHTDKPVYTPVHYQAKN